MRPLWLDLFSSVVTTGHSSWKNGVAEPVIGPATSDGTRWLAYDPVVHAEAQLTMDCRVEAGNDERVSPTGTGIFRFML
jgi:hypothetical protein